MYLFCAFLRQWMDDHIDVKFPLSEGPTRGLPYLNIVLIHYRSIKVILTKGRVKKGKDIDNDLV